MSIARRVELVCGVLTGVVATVAAFALLNLNSPDQFLPAFFIYILPALLVAVGAGLHIIGFRSAGSICGRSSSGFAKGGIFLFCLLWPWSVEWFVSFATGFVSHIKYGCVSVIKKRSDF